MIAIARRFALVAVTATLGCSSEQAEKSPPCEQPCLDGVAIRSLRETMKLVYNLTLQGNPVGAQDETTPCPLGGSAHVFGSASSNPVQGATEVNLSYELDACHYLSRDENAGQNYDMTLTGTVTQVGTLAVQPSATMGLILHGDSVTFSGTVYDPPKDYQESACVVELAQSGDRVTGTICGREAGVDL